MAGYVIVDVTVTDPIVYQEYAKLVPATIAAYGGEYIIRGGTVEAVEGDWKPQRFVVLKFESVARAKEWLNSPEYTPIKQMRFASANSKMLIVEGV
jgi:uncharacterized protein (DUF1330 family)